MATNREERFLMRQRGAGVRQIQDFNFGLVLPGVALEPLKSQRPERSRKTPQPDLLPRRSSRAPSSAKKLLPRRSSRTTPATTPKRPTAKSTLLVGPDETREGGLPISSTTGIDGDGTARKRRKLNYIGEALVDNAVSPERNANTQLATFAPPVHKDNVQEHPKGVRPKKRKKRKPIGQYTKRRTKPSLSETLPEKPARMQAEGAPLQILDYDQPVEEAEPQVQEQVDQNSENRKEKPPLEDPEKRNKATPVADVLDVHDPNPLAVESIDQAIPDAPSIAPAKPKIRRKKRKSIGVIPKKRNKGRPQEVATVDTSALTTNTETALHKEPATGPISQTEHPSSSNAEDHHVESLTDSGKVLDDTSKPSERRNRGRLRKATVPGLATSDTQSKSVLPKPLRSKPQKNPATKVNVEKDTTKPICATRNRRKDQDSVPITIQHLSHTPALAVDDEDDDDPLASDPFPKKVGVNAIDVLSQICKEVIEKTAETLAQGAANETSQKRRSEWKRKARDVKVFGDELDDRFFHMAEALDHQAALTTRLRKTTKENKTLKAQLLDLQQAHKVTALRTQELKTRRSTLAKATQTEDSLNRMLHDIKNAVRRGRALQRSQKGSSETEEMSKDSLELLLRTLASDVSSVQGKGLLDQVKEFNKLLERAVEVG